jgi:steroid delta-isomerase-like uncharacterized protein
MSATATTGKQELVKRDIELWNSGETDTVEEIYADDATFTDPMGEVHDLESYFEYVESIRTAFPDFDVEIEEFFETEGSVGCRYTFSGTMEGTFRGFEPTGGAFELHGIAMCHVEDGEIVEWWNATNSLAIAQQAGVLG